MGHGGPPGDRTPSGRQDALGTVGTGNALGLSGTQPRLPTTAAERREHSRRTSQIHSRNLSAFFPRPGTDAEQEYHAEAAASGPAPTGHVAHAGTAEVEALPAKHRLPKHIRRASYAMTDAAGNTESTRRLPSVVPARTFFR